MNRVVRNAVRACAVVAMCLGASLGAASAQSIVSTGQSFVTARLLPGEATDDGARLAGLRLSMTPGWKTYWRSPGRAGIPPRFDWTGSENIASVEVLWPRPMVFDSFGMRTVGYDEEVVLPLVVTPVRPGEAMRLVLTAELGVCREICVLEEVTAAEAIPVDMRPIGHRQIARAMKSVPVPAADVGVSVAHCRIVGGDGNWTLEAGITSDSFGDAPDVLVEGSERLWVYESTTEMTGTMLNVTADIMVPTGTSWVDRSAVRFTVLGAGYAADIQGCSASAG